MANPQLENGYFRIANEIAEALMRTNLSAYQSRILWAIFRRTYGFNKKEDWLPNSQLVELTGLWKQHIYRTIKELVGRNLVTKRGYKIAFNKDYQQWRELSKGVTSHSKLPIGVTQLPKGVTGVTNRGGHKRKQCIKNTLRDSEKPNPAVKEFLIHWGQAFKEKTGQDYFINGGKEASHIKRMLKFFPLERLKELGKVYFKSENKFFQDSGYTIGFFFSQINKIVIEAERLKKTW